MVEQTPGRPTTPSTITDEQRVVALRAVNRAGARERWFLEWMKTFVVAVLMFFVVRTFIVEAFKIPSSSMERTLLVGDFLLVNKMLYGAEVPFTGVHLPAIRAPRRGDVAVFEYPPDPTKNFVKRIVGLPGDTVSMRGGALLVNDQLVPEPYVRHSEPDDDPPSSDFGWQLPFLVRAASASASYEPSRNNWGPLVVPASSYFVLGDNRDNSLDSRYWGFVPDTLLKGRPIFVYYSFVPDSADHLAWLTHVRWSRLGERVK